MVMPKPPMPAPGASPMGAGATPGGAPMGAPGGQPKASPEDAKKVIRNTLVQAKRIADQFNLDWDELVSEVSSGAGKEGSAPPPPMEPPTPTMP